MYLFKRSTSVSSAKWPIVCAYLGAATLSLAWILLGCSVEPQTEGQGGALTGTKTGLDGRSFRDDDFLCRPATTKQKASLALQSGDEVTYEDHIQGILEEACVSCHSEAAGIFPDLSNYELAVASGSASVEEVEAGSMPTAGPLSDEQKALFRAWEEGGFLQTSTNDENDNGNDDSGGEDGSDTGSSGQVDSGEASYQCGEILDDTTRSDGSGSGDKRPRGTDSGESDGSQDDGDGTGDDGDGTDAGDDSGGDGNSDDGDDRGDGDDTGSGDDGGDAGTDDGGDTGGDDGADDGSAALTNYMDDTKSIIDAKCVGCHDPGGTSPDLSTYDGASGAGNNSLNRVVNETMPPPGQTPLSQDEIDTFQAWADDGFPEVDQ